MGYIIFGIICGVVTALIASSKGRNAVGWFFIGFLFGILGIIVAAVVGNERERERMHASARAERRRLREKLRQEQMKSEAYRRHSEARLNTHDRALGMDTRGAAPLPAGHGMHPQPLAAGGDIPEPPVKEWQYDLGDGPRGPVSAGAIRKGLAEGKINATTLVWRDGMESWRAVSEIQMFRSSFQA